MADSSLLMAIDAGGSGSRAVLFRATGEVVSKAYGDSCNYQSVGSGVVEGRIRSLLSSVTEILGQHPTVECAVFGMAGLDTERDLQLLRRLVEHACNDLGIKIAKIIVENDGLVATRGTLGDGPGLALIAGTGSITYGVKGNVFIRVGGWGHRLGDEGSGFWIGKLGLMHVLRSLDGRESASGLTRTILEKLGLQSADDVVHWIYSSSASVEQVAALAPFILSLAMSDATAHGIFTHTRNELVRSVSTAVDRLDLQNGSFKVALMGGILKGNQSLRSTIVTDITGLYDGVTVVQTNLSPLGAGALVALNVVSSGSHINDRSIVEKIEMTVN